MIFWKQVDLTPNLGGWVVNLPEERVVWRPCQYSWQMSRKLYCCFAKNGFVFHARPVKHETIGNQVKQQALLQACWGIDIDTVPLRFIYLILVWGEGRIPGEDWRRRKENIVPCEVWWRPIYFQLELPGNLIKIPSRLQRVRGMLEGQLSGQFCQ